MSADGRLAGYEWVDNPNRGTSGYAGPDYYPYKPIIFCHQTVSRDWSRSAAAGHGSPPHLWANPYSGRKFQTQELDLAAKAIYQPQFGYHWTNKHAYTLQTEIIGVPVVSQATYTEEQDYWIAENVIVPKARWLLERDLPIDLHQVRYHENTSGSASEYWHGRMSEQEMAEFNGLMCHIDAWGNDHWDCSAERTYLWAQFAREILGLQPVKRKTKTMRKVTTQRILQLNGT